MKAPLHLSDDPKHLDIIVTAACELALAGDARAICIMTKRRPTYPELLRDRDYAQHWASI